ncbi:hypothetical protein [Agromyces sp. H66]|uniref:hypothetical protein n=1 Tax=Agromyces sp. H66 TaxID=2529859 RepID=UPI0010A9FC37|nr:hypothetical protein [Agromyces sp. H66]
MPIRPAPLLLAAAITVAISLSGCSSTPTDSAAAPPSEAAPSTAAPDAPASSSSAPEPPAPDLADPKTWTASPAGIGPLLVGAKFDRTITAVGPYARTEGCPNPDVIMFAGEGLAPLWIALDGDTSTIGSVMVMAWPSSEATEVAPTTDAGIGLGDSEADLLAAYPGILQTAERNGSVTYAMPEGSSWLVVVVNAGVVHTIAAANVSTLPPEYCG